MKTIVRTRKIGTSRGVALSPRLQEIHVKTMNSENLAAPMSLGTRYIRAVKALTRLAA